MRRSPPPARACSRSSRRCSIFSCVVLAWMPSCVSLARRRYFLQARLGNRSGVGRAGGGGGNARVPGGARGQLVDAPLHAVLDNRAHLTLRALSAPLVPC